MDEIEYETILWAASRLVPVLVCGNPEANARQDGEAVAGIAYCEFQHGNFLLSWFLVWRMKELTLMRNVCM